MIEYNEMVWENDTGHPLSADNLNRFERLLASIVSEINNFHKHWWRKSKVIGGDVEVKAGGINFTYYIGSNTDASVTVYYSDSVTPFADSNGDVYAKLDNPSSITFSYNNIVQGEIAIDILNQKYFIVGEKEGAEVLFGKGNINQSIKNGSPNQFGFSIYSGKVNLVKVYGDVEYVNSEDAGAYPNGWSDEDAALYEYLGIPFENSRDAKLNQG